LGAHGRAVVAPHDALTDDFDEGEIDEARELAYEAGLGEAPSLVLIGPDDDSRWHCHSFERRGGGASCLAAPPDAQGCPAR
jgi:hypothetical protein